MPSVSKKQHNLMAMVANNPSAAKRVGIPQSVGKDFMSADTGRKFSKGGEMAESMKAKEMRHARTLSKLAKEEAAEAKEYKRGGGVKASAMGKVKTAAPSKDGVATKGKTKGTMITMKKGGRCG